MIHRNVYKNTEGFKCLKKMKWDRRIPFEFVGVNYPFIILFDF